jgi:hypothetical protein
MGVLQPLLERKYFLFWTVFPYSQMSQSSRHLLNTRSQNQYGDLPTISHDGIIGLQQLFW